jgi:hypothetical protein
LRVCDGSASGLGATPAGDGEDHQRVQVAQAATRQSLGVERGLLAQDPRGLGASVELEQQMKRPALGKG